jgi:pilus assembly protein CpaB
MKTRQMSPRQRQGLLLLLVAVVGLVGVFVLIARYVASVSHQVGSKIEVLELTRPVAAYQAVSAADLGEVSVPAKWAPPNALREPAQAQYQVTQTPLSAGTVLQQGMLSAPPRISPGQEEISIVVDQSSGVDYQINAGDKVDVVATFGDSANGAGGNLGGTRAQARIVVHDATVVSVGSPTSQGQAVTFALTPAEVQHIAYANSFAQSVRLSLIAPNTSVVPSSPRPYAPKGL